MSDLPVSLESQNAYARPKTGEELELLGKSAAAKYIKSGTPLTEAVIETVKHAGLGPEQVRRVAEFANVEAYLQTFQKQSGDHRYIQFEGGPADVPTILRDLNDGGGGTVFDRGVADYSHAPVNTQKLAANNLGRLGLEDAKLASMFGVEEKPLPFADPLKEVYDFYRQISDAREKIAFDMSVEESRFADKVDSMFSTIKQASFEGVPLGHVVQAWSSVTENPEFVKAAFMALTPRLLENGVFSSRDHIGSSLEKTAAGAMVDPTHPLVQDFEEFCGCLSKLAEMRVMREEMTSALDELGTFIRGTLEKTAAADKAGDFVDALESGAGMLRSGWDTASTAAAAASEPTRRVVTALAGPLAGRAAGGFVRHSPKIGLGLLGESVYQHAKYSPAIQATKNFVLSRIPYTHPYMVRQYQMQMGGL